MKKSHLHTDLLLSSAAFAISLHCCVNFSGESGDVVRLSWLELGYLFMSFSTKCTMSPTPRATIRARNTSINPVVAFTKQPLSFLNDISTSSGEFAVYLRMSDSIQTLPPGIVTERVRGRDASDISFKR